MRALALIIMLTLVQGGLFAASRSFHLWQEGEGGNRQAGKDNDWYTNVDTTKLSGGAWMATFGSAAEAVFSYEVKIPKSDSYSFWVRANPVQAAMSYRIGKGEWTAIDFSTAIQKVNIASDKKPDLRYIGWVDLGEQRIKKGENTVEFRCESTNGKHGAIDCFVITNEAFRPAEQVNPWQPEPCKVAVDKRGNILVEGEDASLRWLEPDPNWYDSVKKGELSGQAWASHFTAKEPGELLYMIPLKRGGSYQLWLRCNPVQSAVSYQLNGSDWQAVDMKAAQAKVNIASDDKADLRYIGWVDAGKVKLGKGANLLRIRLDRSHDGINHHGGLDRLVLAKGDFIPGKADAEQ